MHISIALLKGTQKWMGGMERCSAPRDHHNSSLVSGNTNTLPETKNFVPHKLFVEFETRNGADSVPGTQSLKIGPISKN